MDLIFKLLVTCNTCAYFKLSVSFKPLPKIDCARSAAATLYCDQYRHRNSITKYRVHTDSVGGGSPADGAGIRFLPRFGCRSTGLPLAHHVLTKAGADSGSNRGKSSSAHVRKQKRILRCDAGRDN